MHRATFTYKFTNEYIKKCLFLESILRNLQMNARLLCSKEFRMHPFRSVLYLPGSKERVIEKAQNLPADALIFDLEDAVAPDEKENARALVAKKINDLDFGNRKILIRINGEDTPWGLEDAKMAMAAAPDGILLPKVESPEIIQTLSKSIPNDRTKIWAMMETPLGVINAPAIVSADPKLEGFVLGTNDLAKDLRSTTRTALIPAISQVLLAARAFNAVCVDGVFNAFKDEDGLRKECLEGLSMGMDGKTLIHPSQLEIANEIFAPDPALIEIAHRQVTAFNDAISKGEAVAVVDGKIVENLHVETAKRLIALDESIKAMSK